MTLPGVQYLSTPRQRSRGAAILADKPRDTLGRLIKRERESKGWSQRKLAKRAGVSNNYISQLEKDYSPSSKSKTARPRLDNIDRVARALDLPVSKVRLLAATTAGYLAPDTNKLDGFDESEFALMYQDVAKLTPQQKRDFRIAWEMAKAALRRIKQEGDK